VVVLRQFHDDQNNGQNKSINGQKQQTTLSDQVDQRGIQYENERTKKKKPVLLVNCEYISILFCVQA